MGFSPEQIVAAAEWWAHRLTIVDEGNERLDADHAQVSQAQYDRFVDLLAEKIRDIPPQEQPFDPAGSVKKISHVIGGVPYMVQYAMREAGMQFTDAFLWGQMPVDTTMHIMDNGQIHLTKEIPVRAAGETGGALMKKEGGILEWEGSPDVKILDVDAVDVTRAPYLMARGLGLVVANVSPGKAYATVHEQDNKRVVSRGTTGTHKAGHLYTEFPHIGVTNEMREAFSKLKPQDLWFDPDTTDPATLPYANSTYADYDTFKGAMKDSRLPGNLVHEKIETGRYDRRTQQPLRVIEITEPTTVRFGDEMQQADAGDWLLVADVDTDKDGRIVKPGDDRARTQIRDVRVLTAEAAKELWAEFYLSDEKGSLLSDEPIKPGDELPQLRKQAPAALGPVAGPRR